MKRRLLSSLILLTPFLITPAQTSGQNTQLDGKTATDHPGSGWFSLGARSTLNLFSYKESGIGTGGHFRIQLSDRVNTEWFGDYIVTNRDRLIRSEYYHIGWSVIFYPLKPRRGTNLAPYIQAGHCFDFNRKTLIANSTLSGERWGSAVQAGIGAHYFLGPYFDISISSQFMTHLTPALEFVRNDVGDVSFVKGRTAEYEGHMLLTISTTFRVFRAWKK